MRHGVGRGKRTGHRTHAIQCARNVMLYCKDRTFNWRYNAWYFGKAMRGHVESASKDNMQIAGLPDIVRAEALLVALCDGQDCSFQDTRDTGLEPNKKVLDDCGEALTADGFEDAIIGHAYDIVAGATRIVYDLGKMVKILMKRDKMTREVAVEFLDFNTVQAYVGPNSPIFMNKFEK